MGKIKSLKISMIITFLITVCVITLVSGVTIFVANQTQQEVLKKRQMVISSPNLEIDEQIGGYVIDIDKGNIKWKPLSTKDSIAYYGSYVVMIGFPVLYIIVGIGVAAAVYYRKKLRTPITQLQNGVERIQENDLDFHIEYDGDDELGQLCCSMERMRSELRQKHKALWESLEQRKLLNASVAHDLRTPLTVLKGYLDYLEKSILQNKITEDELMDTVSSMQGAVIRLERYVECVRDVEKFESIEIKKQPENMKLLLNEMESNVSQLAQGKEILFSNSVSLDEVNIDKSVLFRILENLLQNALRYSEKQINIDISQKDKFFVLTVKDDGQGFTEAGLRKATTVFYSMDKGREHFGIGLSVCRLLCEKHGGLLYIRNNKGKGACVIAELNIF